MPNARAIVRVNPAFYRTRRTPVELRAILVLVRTDEHILAQRQQMFREFDWEALKRLLVR